MELEDKIEIAYHLYQKNGGMKSQEEWEEEILNPYTGSYSSWEEYFKAQCI